MSDAGLQFAVLGPLQLRAGSALVPLGAPKLRAVLAMLVMNRNRAVSVDALIDAVWGESPVPAARTSIHSYVSNLRRLLGSASRDPNRVLVSVPPGYQGTSAIADLRGNDGQRYRLEASNRIGRRPDNDIVLDDDEVSRYHAVVIDTGSEFVISDLRSTNGVEVAGRRIRGSVTLADGDRIRIGSYHFTFQIRPR